MLINSTTYFGCDYTIAIKNTGINTFFQGFFYIIYDALLTVFMIPLVIYFIYKLNQIKRQFGNSPFLLITTIIWFVYLIFKIAEYLMDILYCSSFNLNLYIKEIPFILFILSIDFYNLAMCTSLIEDFPEEYIKIINQIVCIRYCVYYGLFPLLGVEFTIFILSRYYPNLTWTAIILSLIIFSLQFLIILIFGIKFRTILKKKESKGFERQKCQLFFMFFIIGLGFLIKIAWTFGNQLTSALSGGTSWYGSIRNNCFKTGCFLSMIINISYNFFSEITIILSISLFLCILFREINHLEIRNAFRSTDEQRDQDYIFIELRQSINLG